MSDLVAAHSTLCQRGIFPGNDDHLDYWKGQIVGAPAVLEFPADRPRPAIQSGEQAVYNIHFPASLRDGLNALSEQQEATLLVTLLSTFKVLVHRYCGQHDLVIGVPTLISKNKSDGSAEYFVNTLPFRTSIAGNPRFVDFLQRVRATASAAFAHEDIPFSQLVEALQIQCDCSYHPLFQIIFTLHSKADGAHRRLPALRAVESAC